MTLSETILLAILINRRIKNKNNIVIFFRRIIILYSTLLLNTNRNNLNRILWNNNIQLLLLLTGLFLLITITEQTRIKIILTRLILSSIVISITKDLTLLYIIIEFQTIITLAIISLSFTNAHTKEASIKYFTLTIFSSILILTWNNFSLFFH